MVNRVRSVMDARKHMRLTDQQEAKLDALAPMSDDDIDTSDIPEVVGFSNARRGPFARSPNRRAVPKLEMMQHEPVDDGWDDNGGLDDEQGSCPELVGTCIWSVGILPASVRPEPVEGGWFLSTDYKSGTDSRGCVLATAVLAFVYRTS